MMYRSCGYNKSVQHVTIDLLKDTFGDRLISRFGPVNWPPRSCDLTPLDYFLWGYVKSLLYADKPQTLDHLEDNIRRVIADIRPQMLEKVIENWTSRLDYIRESRGNHMPEIIFKICDLSRGQQNYCTDRVLAIPDIDYTKYPHTLSRSLDLSPIEHIWDHLGRQVGHLERTRGKFTAKRERNVSRHHVELVCLNAQSYRIVHSSLRVFNRVLNPPFFCLFL
ncbi:putative transposable element [Trichonephila clavipes]|nr:putative transposable element [Trichonephila clavipes]